MLDLWKDRHTKTNCLKGKKAKKVNFVYQSEPEESESEDDSSSDKEQSSEEEEESDEEPRNSYSVKKSGTNWSSHEEEEIPYFQI